MYLSVEGAPSGTAPQDRLTALPIGLALQAEGFPHSEAERLEQVLHGMGSPGEHVANLCPVLLGYALGAQVAALVRDYRVCRRCGQRGCGARLPGSAAREAAAAWAAAFDATRASGKQAG